MWHICMENRQVPAMHMRQMANVVMDALVVREAFRKRYVATTLMKHIASQFKEEMFLHADADDTPKEMYRKMGFETVDELYEYLKMW